MKASKRSPKRRHVSIPKPQLSQPHRLRKYADEHLNYEVTMFFSAVAAFAYALDSGRPLIDSFFTNARIEVFGIHLRNLVVFLYPDHFSLRAGDVAAHHFMAARSQLAFWKQHRLPLTPVLRRAKARADKELAHMTDRRIAGRRANKAWPVLLISEDMRLALLAFLRMADASRVGTTVPGAVPAEPIVATVSPAV